MAMLPNANDLHFFLEVAQTGNLSRAAERLGVSQPALSQAMKRLEVSFENQLLLRSKSGVVLTKAGEKLSQRARLLLESWQEIKDDALKDEDQVRGVYSFGLHSSVALYTLPIMAPDILADFPFLELKFEHDLSRKITEKVISFKLDFGIVVNPISHPDLVIKELFCDEVCFYKARKIKKENESVLIAEPDLNQTQELLNQLQKKKVSFDRMVTSSNLEVIKAMVVNGAGVGIVPGRVMGADLKKVEKLAKLPTFKDRICLVYRHDFQKSLAARSLSQYIIKKLTSA